MPNVISRGGPWATVAAGETKFCTEQTANSYMPPPLLPLPPRLVMVATNDVKFVFPLKFTLPLCRLQLTTINPAFYFLPLTIRPFKTLPAGRPVHS